MADNFATIADIESLWRPLTSDEETRAAALLPVVSDSLRVKAQAVGRDLDEMVAESATYENVVRSVTVDIVARTLRQSTSGEPTSQESQSALGYSWSGTSAIPGGGLGIMRNDLKRLGLLRQRYGVIDMFGVFNHD